MQTDPEALDESDMRKIIPFPRFQKENFPKVQTLLKTFAEIGAKHNASPAQIALAWLLAQGDNVIPIPGTTKVEVRLCS